jgi:hypothetical protein
MAQYRTFTDDTGYFRIGVRDAGFVIDQTISPATDFTGTEDVNWEELVTYKRET